MTLAEFYATHRSPQAIIVPRRTIRAGTIRRISSERPTSSKPSVAAASPSTGGADKKH
jgi:hypothetical protein